MSLSHLALRLAVIEALAPATQHQALVPVWPTLAMGRVLDSQIEAMPGTEAEARTPLIAVYTDDAKREPKENGPDSLWSGVETVTLAFEVMVPVLVTVDPNGQSIPPTLVPTAETDPMAEAYLNLIGAQIRIALKRATMDGLLRHVLISVSKIESRAWTDADTALRLSARRFEMECVVRSEDDPDLAAEGLARLPSPLRDVAQGLHASSYGSALCQTIADALGDPAAGFPRLNEIRLAVNFERSAGSTLPPAPNPVPTPPVADGAAQVTLP